MVGDILRKEREKQGMTVADIERATSIRALYIQYIEQGNIEALPGMVYAKGFVRNYAAFLRLNAEQLALQFAEEQGMAAPPPPPAVEEKPRRISLSSVGDESLSHISIGGTRSSYAGIFGKLAAGIIVLVAVVGGGMALLSYINTPRQEAASAPPVQAEKPAAAAVAAEADASDEARGADAANSQDVRVSVRVGAPCWAEVQTDGNTVFEGMLEQGKTENWQGKEAVFIRAGNAGALEVTANGRRLGKFGAEGEVVERRFTRSTKDLKDTLSASAAAEPVKETKTAGAKNGVEGTAKDSKRTKNRQ